MSFSKISLFSSVSFIVGIFLNLITQNAHLILLGVSFFSSLFLFLIFKKLRWLVLFCLIFFILGFLRADFSKNKVENNRLQNFNNSEVVLKGIIIKEPEISHENQKLVVRAEKIKKEPPSSNSASINHSDERVLLYAPIYPLYKYGDEIEVWGRLEAPPTFEDFDYKRHLAQKKIFSIMFSPQTIRVESAGRGSWFYKKILGIKSKLRATLEQKFPSSQEILLGAIILGEKSSLTGELKNTLNRAGIRHLTAISGMHIVILINLLMLIFLGLGLWRWQAFGLTAVLILFFVLMIGGQPSAIRAGIMGFLLLLGQILGRAGDSFRAIVLGAGLMLAANPFLLTEASFQLSFLAVLGINYLAPIFSKWLKEIPNTVQIRNVLAMSLAAQAFTLPILIYNFGYVSLIAPVTNLLVLPLLPFIIIFGFLSAFFGIFSHFLALIFVFPCWLLLSYLLKIADIFSSLSFSSINLKISFFWALFYYLFLVYLIWQWRRDHRFKILGF